MHGAERYGLLFVQVLLEGMIDRGLSIRRCTAHCIDCCLRPEPDDNSRSLVRGKDKDTSYDWG